MPPGKFPKYFLLQIQDDGQIYMLKYVVVSLQMSHYLHLSIHTVVVLT